MSTTTKTITIPGEIRPGERRELKALVRKKIAVLRAQVDRKYAEQVAEVDRAVAEQFKSQDERMTALRAEIEDLTKLSNLKLETLLSQYADVVDVTHYRRSFSTPQVYARNDGRSEARNALLSAASAEKAAAHHRLTELETQLEEELTLDGLRTDAAKEFVRNMPDVATVLAGVQKPAELEGVSSNGN